MQLLVFIDVVESMKEWSFIVQKVLSRFNKFYCFKRMIPCIFLSFTTSFNAIFKKKKCLIVGDIRTTSVALYLMAVVVAAC